MKSPPDLANFNSKGAVWLQLPFASEHWGSQVDLFGVKVLFACFYCFHFMLIFLCCCFLFFCSLTDWLD